MNKVRAFLIILSLLWTPLAVAKRGNEVAEQYVRLVLALGQHDPMFVDAYYGPASWQQEAKAKPLRLQKIIDATHHLKNSLILLSDEDISPRRKKFISAQLTAVIARAVMLSGEKLNFEEQAKLLFNTQLPRRPLESFEKALVAIDRLLPGSEPLALRVAAFKQKLHIPDDRIEAVFDKAIAACKQRTKAFLALPENEAFVLTYVNNKPWSGYNWYQGNAKSLIQINTDLPIEISRAVDLGCHEGYPGHHVFNMLLEKHLVQDKGWIEFSVYPLFSPQSLIAEGTANYGIDLAFPDEQKLLFEKSVLYPAAGLPKQLADKYQQLQTLMAELSFAGTEIARQFIDGEIDEAKAMQLLQKYQLMDAQKAAKRIKFWQAYGAYVINYNWGKLLVKNFVERGYPTEQEKWQRFEKLLTEPYLPSELEWLANQHEK